jgi:hypothetical protein
MNPDNRGGLKDVLLGGLCGAVISAVCTFCVLMLIMFAEYNLSFGSTAALLWVHDKWSIFRDSGSMLIVALGSLPGAVVGMILGKVMGRRQVTGGLDLVIGCAGLAVIGWLSLVFIRQFLGPIGGDVPLFANPVAMFGSTLAGIIGALVGFVLALLRRPPWPPRTLPDSGWGSDRPAEKNAPAPTHDQIATNPGQVFHRSTGERDA